MITREEWLNAVEAMLFAAGEPLGVSDVARALDRLATERAAVPAGSEPSPSGEAPPPPPAARELIDELKARWTETAGRGFVLSEVADGVTFRTHPRYADAVRAMREERPARLSRAALETLAIVAYRQPATKPEIDHIRGVDSSASIHLLLSRSLIRIAGKKEEPGRPLLYATTREFLSFFNLKGLTQLPSLRDYHELNEESQEEIAAFDGTVVEELRARAKPIPGDEEPGVQDLEEAMSRLRTTEEATRDQLAQRGIALTPVEPSEAPADGQAGTPESGESAAAGAPTPAQPPTPTPHDG